MKFLKLKLIFVLLLLFQSTLATAADICATASQNNPNAIDGGMGGTGDAVNRGMGGTGAPESGMGGTGILERGGLGGTGIVSENADILPDNSDGSVAIMGVITGFASICVNGEEVHYENATPIYSNGQPAKLGYLAVGKNVMLKAERVNGRLNAKAIGLYDAVAGPMGRIDIARQQMHVMGQTVRMSPQVMQQARAMAPNANISVSGHRLNNGEIIATRVDAVPAGRANTIGVVTNITNNSMNVNGTRVNVGDTKMLENLKVGSEVRVTGDWSGNTLKASRIDAQPTKRLISRAESAILEGYVSVTSQGGALYGAELSFTQGNARSKKLETSNGKLVKIELRRDTKGDWVYDKVEERKGHMFDKYEGKSHGGSSNSGSDSDSNLSSNSGSSSNSGEGANSASDSNSNSHSDSSGHGSNSGSNKHSSSSGSSDHGSSSNSGSRDSSSRSSGSSGSSHGGDTKIRVERVEKPSKSSGSSSSER